MFSPLPRCAYRKNQLAQVICQLRFPEILAISAHPPVDFQEAIRAEFPRYEVKREVLSAAPGSEPKTTLNHHFISEDGAWRVNLTGRFISLSTSKYTTWEEFARKLDKPLASFITTYQPAYFERIGLRYINFISRKALELEDCLFSELFRERYVGILADEDLKPSDIMRANMDVEFQVRGGCRAKLHVGPGIIKTPQGNDPEVKFIFDQDLYMPGNVQVQHSAPALHTLHSQAFSIFRDAITDRLHQAMEPEEL